MFLDEKWGSVDGLSENLVVKTDTSNNKNNVAALREQEQMIKVYEAGCFYRGKF